MNVEADTGEFETLLRRALRPVEPSPDLARRMESALENLTDFAAGELEAWEGRDKTDPRTWMRISAAVAVGASAGTVLVIVRTRRRARRRSTTAHPRELERVARDLGVEARRLLRRG